MKPDIFRQIFEKCSNTKSRPVGVEFFMRTERRTEEQTWCNYGRFSEFCQGA